MLDIAYIIPCYNEEKTILPTIKQCLIQLRKLKKEYKYTYKIFVYDNNSTDDTKEKILKAVNKYPNEIVYRFEPMQGKGYVIRTAFQSINAKCYVMTDGDNTYSQEKLPEFVNKILIDDYDMVTGDRLSNAYKIENKRRFHTAGNHIMRKAINILFGTDYTDVLSGFRSFSYTYAKTLSITSGGFTIETEMCCHAGAHHMRTTMIEIDYIDREDDNSKINTISDGIKIIYKLIYLYQCYAPITFYGLLSLIGILLGTGFLIPIVMDFTKTGYVDKFPTLFICGFAILLGILLFANGLNQYTNQIRHTQIYENILCYYRSNSDYKCYKEY